MEKKELLAQGCAVVPDILAALDGLRRQLADVNEAVRINAAAISALRTELAAWQSDHTADCNELLRRLNEHELPHELYHQAVAAVIEEHRAKRGDYQWRTIGQDAAGPPA